MRKEGFYWVMTGDDTWKIAEWEWGYWTLTGANSSIYADKDFLLIDETPIERNKVQIIHNGNVADKTQWESEEWYCVNEVLNKLNVPKEDANGKSFSTVGRIYELIRMGESNNYPERQLSSNDDTESIINKTLRQ